VKEEKKKKDPFNPPLVEKKEEDPHNVTGQALLALAPTLIGGLFGGNEGAAIGAKAGREGLNQFQTAQKEEQKRLDKEKERKALLDAEKAKTDSDRAFKRELQQEKNEFDLKLHGLKGDKAKKLKNEKLFVPELGEALTEDDAKKLKDAKVMKEKFDRQMGELISLRKEFSGFGGEVLNRDAVSRGKQLSKDILLTYKNLAKLGVLSKSDEDIINAIIPEDPLQFDFSSMIPFAGQNPTLKRMEAFKNDLNEDFNSTLRARLRTPIQPQEPPKTPPKIAIEEVEKLPDEELDKLYFQLGGRM